MNTLVASIEIGYSIFKDSVMVDSKVVMNILLFTREVEQFVFLMDTKLKKEKIQITRS